jgi:hypothetical protein
LLTFNLLRLRLDGLPFNLDPARPQNLRYLAHELDREQAIHEAGSRDLHMIRELKALLERAGANAAVQELSFRTGRLVPTMLTLDEQEVPLGGDRELILPEPGDSEGDAVSVLAGTLDVVGRETVPFCGPRLALCRRSKTRSKPTVEPNSGPKS